MNATNELGTIWRGECGATPTPMRQLTVVQSYDSKLARVPVLAVAQNVIRNELRLAWVANIRGGTVAAI